MLSHSFTTGGKLEKLENSTKGKTAAEIKAC